jgi:hypothetical protein
LKRTGAREMEAAADESAGGSSRFAYSDMPLRGGAGGPDIAVALVMSGILVAFGRIAVDVGLYS